MKTVDDATLAAAAEATAHVPTDDELKQARKLAVDLVSAQEEIAHFEEGLARWKKEYKDLSERQLPQALNALGLTALTLDSGWALELKPFAAVGVIKERQRDALDELVTVGAADLVKNQVTVTFGRGEDEEATHLAWLLKRLGWQPTQERSVNFQTLNAWFREQVRQDPLFRLDPELFTIFVGQVAKLEEPKQS